MPEPEMEGLTNFLYEMGLLKRYKRTGWWIAGIDNPESIAEHSFRTAIIGYLLAVMEGADPARTAALCVFHDTQETRIGDVPSVGKAYVVTAPNPEVTADQVADFQPRSVGRCASSSTSTRPTRPSRPSSPRTPTSWSASSKPASTRLKATRTYRPGSRPRRRRCEPSRLAGSPRPASRSRLDNGGGPSPKPTHGW
jgi:HD domain-containing protein